LEGYQTAIVSTPNDLSPALGAAGPALVLMGVRIAQARTFGSVRGSRSDESLETLPVVMTSGTDYRQISSDAGANALLARPFRPPELLPLIAGLVESKEED
jgi:DNA-binding response OmpR family regulator